VIGHAVSISVYLQIHIVETPSLFADTIPGSNRKWSKCSSVVTCVFLIVRQPSLWNKRIGILEVDR
jgi:hypothetical protein